MKCKYRIVSDVKACQIVFLDRFRFAEDCIDWLLTLTRDRGVAHTIAAQAALLGPVIHLRSRRKLLACGISKLRGRATGSAVVSPDQGLQV